MGKRSRSLGQEVKSRLLFRVAYLCLHKGKRVAEIAEIINEEFRNELDVPYSREAIYPMLAQAAKGGFVRFFPPLGASLEQELHEQFGHAVDSMRVVGLDGETGAEMVTAAAADLVMEKILELSNQFDRPVGLGLGPGRATLAFCHHLSSRLNSEVGIRPKCLRLHAITAGGANMHPENAPVSFFNLFARQVVAQSVGFFAESLVTAARFSEMKSQATLGEVFEERDKIDIVVTSRGDFSHDHDLLGEMLRKEMGKAEFRRRYGKLAGNVQYRGYTSENPVVESPDQLRAVTLFELGDFVEMAERKNKYVVLLARSCSKCGEPGAESLRPLLVKPNLKVWSHVVMDSAVANGLLNPPMKAASS